jgi:hypothetical protein
MQCLEAIEAALNSIESQRVGLAPALRLELVQLSNQLVSRLQSLNVVLIGEAEAADASRRVAGTPLSSWLGLGSAFSKREAAAAVGQGKCLVGHQLVAAAAQEGRIGAGQARSIGKVLDTLTPELNPGQQQQAEQVMVRLAKHLDSDQLARSAPQVLAEVVPVAADELLETRLQREAEAARRARSLRFYREGGSIRFDGSLPRVDGERLIGVLNAQVGSSRRTAIEARDPAADQIAPEQRRADALVALLDRWEKTNPVAGVGGARVVVKLDYQQLLNSAAGAGVIGVDQQLSVGELRRLCCDAELIPAVLGGASEVLDVGRSARLVTPAIRTALTLRDGGCAFPGCDVRAELCEAHHVDPWWNGGATALHNLVLLCKHHHGLLEPAKFGLRDQWEVEITADGATQFLPPARYDRERRPIHNAVRTAPHRKPLGPSKQRASKNAERDTRSVEREARSTGRDARNRAPVAMSRKSAVQGGDYAAQSPPSLNTV